MGQQFGRSTPGRSGRPLGFVREDAVGAAMNLFWKRGFLGVSARDLADAMAIERSSFYNSFGTRESVFREVLALYGAKAPDAPLEHVRSGQAVVPVLISVMRDVCHVRASDPEARGCLVCNGVAELVGVEDEIGPLLQAVVDQRVILLERLLRQALRQKELPPLPDVGGAARSFVAFLLGLNTLSKVVRDERELWATCRQFLLGMGVPHAALDSEPGAAAVGSPKQATRHRGPRRGS